MVVKKGSGKPEQTGKRKSLPLGGLDATGTVSSQHALQTIPEKLINTAGDLTIEGIQMRVREQLDAAAQQVIPYKT